MLRCYANEDKKHSWDNLEVIRNELKQTMPVKCFPSLILYTRLNLHKYTKDLSQKHNEKLSRLSKEQEKPLLNIQNTVICYGIEKTPPKYVLETLSLGPRNSTIERFDRKDVLAELDGLMEFCRDKKVDEEIITDINIKTLSYIKNCEKQKSPRNLMPTRRYLKEKQLLAVPFDKGIGICVMPTATYNEKIKKITDLPQFQKVEPTRKNAKNPILKEEERIISFLKDMNSSGKLSDTLMKKLQPSGSQPPRLYGLAKIHKDHVPLRPVLSMPGSPYHKIALQVSD